MFARMALPVAGGAPAVWTTAVMFFQAALLGGYAYAHVASRWLGPRGQIGLQLGLAVAAVLALPVTIPREAAPPAAASPVAWLLGVMAVSVGPPFFVLAATAPLLQRWFAGIGAADPYVLYVPSNVGSLAALLAYPTLVEPRLGLDAQRWLWALAYLAFLGFLAACAATVWRSRRAAAPAAPAAPAAVDGSTTNPTAPPPSLARGLRWALLAFAPSSLMLGVTTYLATEVAAIPLFWVLPLALYLATFALAFAPRPLVPPRLAAAGLPLVALPLAMLLAGRANEPILLLMPLHLAALFVAALVCHGALARERPSPRYLTAFYLWLAAGGVLGGVFNGLVAPLVFPTVIEYPLALVLACLLAPGATDRPDTRRQRARDLLLPLGLAVLALTLAAAARRAPDAVGPALALGLPALVCLLFARRPVRFGLGLGALLLAGALHSGPEGRVLRSERSFFGVHRVTRDPSARYHLLLHGSTLHGMQSLDPARRLVPLAYFDPGGPLGQVFDALPADTRRRPVAVVGLGAGTVACHGLRGQPWTFYELDPVVARIAGDGRYFTFLRDCPPASTVVLGDARQTLPGAPDAGYGLIVLDAYTGDAPPVHLLTREALRLYDSKLAPRGLLAFHITNRHLDLAPVLGALARDAGLTARLRHEREVTAAERTRGKLPSRWIAMARADADLGPLAEDRRWTPPPAADGPVWTDDFSSLLRVLAWTRARPGPP